MIDEKLELVSIVIPVYNSEKYLDECLESVLKQTYKNLEIICINDGSVDSSLDILKKYQLLDSRVKIFTKENEGKGGAASARNYGLNKATGKYIQFLDSDDYFEANMISSFVDKAEKNNADIVVCSADFYDEQLKKITHKYTSIEISKAPNKDFFNYKDCPNYIFQIGELIVWNKLFRLDLIRNNNLYFESIPIADDHYLPVLAMVLADRICCVDNTFIHYRVNTGVSQVDSIARNPESSYRPIYSIVKKLKEKNVYEDVKQSYANMNVRLMRYYFDQMTSFDKVKFLHEKFANEIFDLLEIRNVSSDYFYDYRLFEWMKLILSYSAEEIIMMAARGYGATYTTGILRFQFPYDEVKRGSKIILVGKGIVGRYWYAQLLISEYAQVVSWVDSVADIDDAIEYNQIIYT